MRYKKPIGIDLVITKRHVQDDKRPSPGVDTPLGMFPHAPGWSLNGLETDEDLFKRVQPGSFIDPDAFSEVLHRGLYFDYEEWFHRDDPPAPTLMDILRKAYGLDEEITP